MCPIHHRHVAWWETDGQRRTALLQYVVSSSPNRVTCGWLRFFAAQYGGGDCEAGGVQRQRLQEQLSCLVVHQALDQASAAAAAVCAYNII